MRKKLSILLKTAAMLAGGAALMIAGAAPAAADYTAPFTRGPGLWATLPTFTSWEGTYQAGDGTLLWCLSPDMDGPVGGGGGDWTYGTATQRTSWTNTQGVTLSREQLAEIAYVQSTYVNTSVSDVEAAALRGALYMLAGYTALPMGDSGTPRNFQLDDPDSFGSQLMQDVGAYQRALDIVADAQANYNLWDGSTSDIDVTPWPRVKPGDTITATVTLPGIRAGKQVTFTIDRPDGSTFQMTAITDMNDQATVSFTADQTGEDGYGVWAELTNPVAQTYPYLADPLYAHGQTMAVSGIAPRPWFDPDKVNLEAGYQPAIRTVTGAQLVVAGDNLTDTWQAEQGLAGDTLTGTSSLYGPFPTWQAAQTADITGLTPIGTVNFTGTYKNDGTASGTTSGLKVPTTGYYFWYEQLNPTPNGGMPAQQQPGGRGPETTLAVQPTIASQINQQIANPDTALSDTVKLDGLVDTLNGQTITWRLTGSLLGPITPNLANDCTGLTWTSAPTATSIDQAVNATNSTLTNVGRYTLPLAQAAVGCYTYTYTLTGTAPDGSKITATQAPGDPSETSQVTWPAVATQVSQQLALPPTTLSDTVKLAGLYNTGWVYELEGWLYGPLNPAGSTCQGLDWTNAPVATSFTQPVPASLIQADGTATISGVGSYDVAGDTPTSCFTYGERLRVTAGSTTLTGDVTLDTVVTVAHQPGDVTQTGVILRPEIATQASTRQAWTGQSITDTALATGLIRDPSLTYTYKGTLYGPVASLNNVDCDGVNWADAPAANTFTGTLDQTLIQDDGTATITGLGAYTPTEIGCVSYAEDLTVTAADKTTITVNHPVGDVNQTVLIRQPVIATQASANQAEIGQTISDTIQLSGLIPDGQYTYTWSGVLYGPIPPADDFTCNNLDWASAPVALEFGDTLDQTLIQPDGTITLTGMGEHQVTDVGCYTYAETLVVTWADGTTVTQEHPAGMETQTVLVAAASGGAAATGGHPISSPVWPLAITTLAVMAGGTILVRRRQIVG